MEIRTATCHPDRRLTAKGLCRSCYSVRWKQANKPRKPAQRAEITCGHPERTHQGHGLCRGCYKKWHYGQNRETYMARARAWKDASPERYREYGWATRIKAKYGLTREAYAAILTRQGGVCATCGGTDRRELCVDHDHSTGKVRGLLCNVCNRLAGRIEKDWRRTDALIAYLLKHRAAPAA